MSEITTGTTEEVRPVYVYINEIYEEWYDEDMKTYNFDLYTYAGLHVQLRLRKKDIERLHLFMRKEDAEQRYMNHIIGNH